MAELRFLGQKILVTRPVDQAEFLAQAIKEAGGVPLLFPMLEIAPVEDENALHQQIARLGDFDLVIFISPNAVQHGMEAIRKVLGSMPAHVRVAAIGMSSAKALQELGAFEVIVPSGRQDSEGLLDELKEAEGLRVMILRGDGGRELLGDTLRARGAHVEYATCYRRSKPSLAGLVNLDPDALTVTSSEALLHMWQNAPVRFREMPLFVPHERIAQLARQQGWTEVHLTEAGDAGLLSGLLAWARSGMNATQRSDL